MLILSLGDRVAGAVMLAICVIMACASAEVSVIPGQSVYAWMTGIAAALSLAMGIDFVFGCRIMTRLASRREETDSVSG